MIEAKLIRKLIKDYSVTIDGKKYIHVESLSSIVMTIKNWLISQWRGE